VAPKIQVTLQRMQLQQDQVARVSRQLEELRNQMGRFGAEEAAMASQLKGDEAHLAEEQDASRRKQIEDEIKRFKSHLEQVSEQQRMQETQLRGRESELESRLQTEQNRLNELNDRLNALERTLDVPAKQP
jgi:chromosome segregation ATPase